jgi:mannitol 2-dehydrogenase
MARPPYGGRAAPRSTSSSSMSLVPRQGKHRTPPTAFIENRQVFGDIAGSGAFAEDYTRVLTAIHARGVRAALRELLQR